MSSRPFQPNAESLAMRVARSLGMERVAWALRRLHCPVAKDALVLEVGSGGNPYARANVLLDAYEVTRERHWAALVSDRPTVIGFVENLPFKDKAFDFVIASHVLEHSPIRKASCANFSALPRPDTLRLRMHSWSVSTRIGITVLK